MKFILCLKTLALTATQAKIAFLTAVSSLILPLFSFATGPFKGWVIIEEGFSTTDPICQIIDKDVSCMTHTNKYGAGYRSVKYHEGEFFFARCGDVESGEGPCPKKPTSAPGAPLGMDAMLVECTNNGQEICDKAQPGSTFLPLDNPAENSEEKMRTRCGCGS